MKKSKRHKHTVYLTWDKPISEMDSAEMLRHNIGRRFPSMLEAKCIKRNVHGTRRSKDCYSEPTPMIAVILK